MSELNKGLFLKCEKCKALLYLDPYTYWDFKGNVKCAGCDELYYIEQESGFKVVGPEPARGADFKLPGYAETEDLQPLSGTGKTSSPPLALPTCLGRPKNVTKNVRGNFIACTQLKPEDLVGSVWKEIYNRRKYGHTW